MRVQSFGFPKRHPQGRQIFGPRACRSGSTWNLSKHHVRFLKQLKLHLRDCDQFILPLEFLG